MAKERIMVKCRQCGRVAAADEFILDHVYKRMVCPECIKDRRAREQVHEEAKFVREEKLSRKIEDKMPQRGTMQPVAKDQSFNPRMEAVKEQPAPASNGKRRYTCSKCTFEFNYNTLTKVPSKCPYCKASVNC
ncbi:MAG: hypothetical protein PHT54_03255 [Candidatus Nanoarchaeia archaeon]|nr:hypothetical protein [Candidatus Nanoarchaeia archaeon]